MAVQLARSKEPGSAGKWVVEKADMLVDVTEFGWVASMGIGQVACSADWMALQMAVVMDI